MRLVKLVPLVLMMAGGIAAPFAQQTPQMPLTPVREEVQTPIGPPVPTAQSLTRTDLEAWLDGFLPYALQRGDVAGAVVVIVKDGEVLLQKGYGFADLEKRTPVDPEQTLFRPGSVSKLFTWTAVMQLVEQGRLDLDRDINEYLDFRIEPREEGAITLRNLLTHTPGLEEFGKGLFRNEAPTETLGEALKHWTPERIFPPGMPAYSNYGTALAGYIVERVSGKSFDDYVEQHIFQPLGMRRSTFRQPLPKDIEVGMSKGYDVASEPPQPFENVGLPPAGSMSATGADLARFMIAHLQDGRFGDAQILKPETAQLMHGTALTTLPPLNRMLLGFYEHNINGRRVITHGGDTFYFHTELNLFVDDGVGLYISMNSLGKEGAAGPIRSALFEQFADRYLSDREERDQLARGTIVPAAAALHAQMMAGRYDNSRRWESSFLSLLNLVGQTKVVATGDGTIMVPSMLGLNGAPKKWQEIAPFVWVEVGGKERLAATVQDGRVVRFSVDEISPFMVFEPTPWWESAAWLMPLTVAAILALLLTTLAWPAQAFARRHYRATFPFTGRDARSYRLIRIAAVATLATLVAWAVLFSAALADSKVLSPALDGWLLFLLFLHFVSFVVFVGGTAVAGWHAWVVWAGQRRWTSKVWSVVLLVAALTLLWVAVVFKLINFSVNY
ncbi:MAG: serine hydrolase domain-containing protein [Steroidobacteraceae bacterium]